MYKYANTYVCKYVAKCNREQENPAYVHIKFNHIVYIVFVNHTILCTYVVFNMKYCHKGILLVPQKGYL